MPKMSGFIQKEISKGIVKASSKVLDEIFQWEKPKPQSDYWGDVLDELKTGKKNKGHYGPR